MAVNVKEFTSAGADVALFSARDGAGYMIGMTASAPSAGDQDGNPAGRLEGIKNFPHTVSEPQTITVTGDDGVISQYQFEPVDLPSFVFDTGTRNLTFEGLCQGTLTQSVGDSEIGVIQPVEATYQDMIMIIQSQAKSRASGSKNAAQWDILLVPNCQIVPLSKDSAQERAAATIRYRCTTNPTDTFPWGLAVSDANNGCTEAAAFVITAENRIHMHRFTGNASAVQFNLDYTPAEASGDKCHVYVDGVLQAYTTAYTVNTGNKTLDFETGSTPGSGAKIVIWYEYTQ